MNKEKLFFVYGTLKEGYWNHYLLEGGKHIANHATEPIYSLFDGNFPVVERGGTTSVIGELYLLKDDDEIQSVFDLERCSSRIQGDPKNWYDFDIITTPYGEATMFVMDKGKSNRKEILKFGSWNKIIR